MSGATIEEVTETPSATAPVFRLTLVLIGALVVIAIALAPYAPRPGPVIPGINAGFSAVIFLAEISTSFMLFVRFGEQSERWLLLLACAYLYSAIMAVFYMLTFPGALLAAEPAIGTPQSVSWIFITWIFGFALLALLAVALAAGKPVAAERPARAMATGIAAVVGAVACVAAMAIVFTDRLPPMVDAKGFTPLSELASYAAVAMLAAAVAVILLRPTLRNPLFLWLALALSVLALSNIISNIGGGRYTVGWTFCRVTWMLSACALFLYFMGQFVRQQRLLSRTRAVLEERVAQRTADLTATIAQRDLLLREVHHRVKNNFQVVNSLIHFQSTHAKDAETKDVLSDLHRRVYALGLVHQQLMQSSNLATFDVRAFLIDLSVNLAAWPASDQRGITVTAEADPIEADLDFAGPLTLLINELVDGALKRRFPADRSGRITISLRKRSADTVVLTVADNAEVAPAAPDELDSRITTALVKQLKGELSAAHDGKNAVTVVMPHPKVRTGLA